MVYYPIHNEVNLIDLIKESADKRFIFPKVLKQNKLSLFYVKDIKHLTPGKFCIPEPTTICCRAKSAEIDLILVPGIVFDQSGHRIGFGKGYYDRLLKDVTCPKIGVAYDFQIVKNIPSEKHDIPMDIIVTNKSILSVPTKLPIKPTSK